MHLRDYCKARHGATQQLADALAVSGSLVVQWATGKPVAVERCVQIERATKGAVSCEELRPASTWHRVPDPGWKWHPLGRPTLDVSADLPPDGGLAGPASAAIAQQAA